MADESVDVDAGAAQEAVLGGATLLDVRELDEFVAGHAPSARHIRLSELPDRYGELARDRPVVCVCRSGGRSARAQAFLAAEGFRATNLAGGMTAWAAHGLPLIGDRDPPEIR
jgi:rhodanese-related sulfurtransferase